MKGNTLIAIGLFILIFATSILLWKIKTSSVLRNKTTNNPPPASAEKKPLEVSGWIAWWKEKDAFDLINVHSANLKTISPMWYLLEENSTVKEVGRYINKKEGVKQLKSYNLTVIPTLGSELDGTGLSEFLNGRQEPVINKLVDLVITIDADGLDIDLEGLEERDKEKFTLFLEKLSVKLKENNLKLLVTVQAQTGRSGDWKGTKGQDLEKIGKTADEVRVMAYDRHGTFSSPGAITPTIWLKDVIKYNLTKIPKEKLVIGLPSYGYIWRSDSAESLQYDEFIKYIQNLNYSKTRDPKSHELVFKSTEFTGWLSDSTAIEEKTKIIKSFGLNRIVIWNLGGMDQNFFEKLNE